MVHNRTMVRVQVYLSEDELALLDRAGTTSGASRSESIRRAVRHTYGERSLDDRLRALDDSAGAWADRPMAVLSTWTRYAGSRPTTRGARPRLRVVDTSIPVDHLRGHPRAVPWRCSTTSFLLANPWQPPKSFASNSCPEYVMANCLPRSDSSLRSIGCR